MSVGLYVCAVLLGRSLFHLLPIPPHFFALAQRNGVEPQRNADVYKRQDVAFAPENLGVPSEEIRRRVDEALRTVGMYEYLSLIHISPPASAARPP